MDLPDPDAYPKEYYEQDSLTVEMRCASCKRDVADIGLDVDKHIMGCAFRSRWWAIFHYNKEQALKQSFSKVQRSLDKFES